MVAPISIPRIRRRCCHYYHSILWLNNSKHISCLDNQMLTYSKCPRCFQEWTQSNTTLYKCQPCDVLYHCTNASHFWLAIYNFIKPFDILYWFYPNRSCYVGGIGGIRQEVNLPMLPINISPEQLKKYLLFI
jgi:hypothetical protein